MLSKHVEEQIIINHLMGYTRDEIAEITNVSTGSVSNKINEWKKRSGILDIDEIRYITTLMRKSNVDVRQCAKGFQIFQLLKRFKILEENIDVDSELNSLSFFITEIYLKCKEYGLGPNTITSWLLDLLNFTVKNYHYLYKGNSPTSPSFLSPTVDQRNEDEIVPSVSLISDFIEVKKKELEHLFQVEKDTMHSIKNYKEQINELVDKIAHLKQEEESILVFHETFTGLEETLKNDCNIDLRTDLESLARIFSGFKDNGYNITSIVSQYEKAIKLEWDIKYKENQIQALQNQIPGLEKNIRAYQSLLDIHRKNWELYQKLEVMKFGIDELQQLWLTVSEIIRNRSHYLKDFDRIENPVAFFMKDVEDNYHDKLKFEDRVKAKREELSMLNAQVNLGRQNLLSQPLIAPTLLSLFRIGISEQDIIDMSHIFNDSQISQDLPVDDLKSEGILSDSGSNKVKSWKRLRDELKKYGGLKAAIKEQNDQLQKTEREYSSLVYRTQTIGIICQNLINFINFTYTSISHYCHCKATIDAYYREIDIHRRKNSLILILFVTLVAGDVKGDTNEGEKRIDGSNKDRR